MCKNLAENMDILNYEKIARLIEIVTGYSLTPAEVKFIGERIVNIERAYDVREGIRRVHDTLPRRFLEEPVSYGPSAPHVIELEVMLDEYYEARGWDVKTGLPTKAKLLELGLDFAAEELEKLGKLPR